MSEKEVALFSYFLFYLFYLLVKFRRLKFCQSQYFASTMITYKRGKLISPSQFLDAKHLYETLMSFFLSVCLSVWLHFSKICIGEPWSLRELKGTQGASRELKRTQRNSKELMETQGNSRELKGTQGNSRELKGT